MKSDPMEAGFPNRYESILDSFGGNALIFSEVSNQTRAKLPTLSPKDAEIASVCAGVAGPVLCSYVLWILEKSIEMELKRLYFISRDGEILLEIARRLLPAFWPNASIDLRYLMGSRRAWMLPSFTVSQTEIAPYLLRFFDNSSLKTSFARVNLSLRDCQDLLPRYGFASSDWERCLQRKDIKSMTALAMDADLQRRIANQAEMSKEVTLGYLQQEGLFDDVPYGLVDLGWTGSLKGALEILLRLKKKDASPFFLFGRATDHGSDDPSKLYTYHFDIDESKGITVGAERNLSAISVLIETFCASLSDGLRTYELKNGRYTPIFQTSTKLALQEWGYETMRICILRFADSLSEQVGRLKSPFFLSPKVSDALLRTFWRTPTRQEAMAWGQFPYEEDPTASTHHRLVPPVEAGTFWRAFLTGNGFRQISVWSRGVLAVNPTWVRMLWMVCMAGYRVRKTIFGVK